MTRKMIDNLEMIGDLSTTIKQEKIEVDTIENEVLEIKDDEHSEAEADSEESDENMDVDKQDEADSEDSGVHEVQSSEESDRLVFVMSIFY